MSSIEIAESKSIPLTSYRRLPRLLVVAGVLLCLCGAYVAAHAMITVLSRQQPSTGINALFDYPLWALVHFVPGFAFMTLMPLQLWRGFRDRHRRFHRWSGRLVAASGLFLGLSGLMFPYTMPQRPFSEKAMMTAFSVGFVLFLAKAFCAARQRDFVRHREWMIRWFFVGLSIMTQRILLPVFIVTVGIRDTSGFWELFVTAAWLASFIQIGLAEWWVNTTRKKAIVA